MKNNKVSITDLYQNAELALRFDELQFFLDQEPPVKWVQNKDIGSGKTCKYLPIDKVEWMLKRFFKKFSIEILSNNVAFNGVVVCVRLHYLNVVSGTMEFHDGIGSCELQTKKGNSGTDLQNITYGAVERAFPIAKSNAIKDASHHLGRVFGADLNRKGIANRDLDSSLEEFVISKKPETNHHIFLLNSVKTKEELEILINEHPNIDYSLIEKRREELK